MRAASLFISPKNLRASYIEARSVSAKMSLSDRFRDFARSSRESAVSVSLMPTRCFFSIPPKYSVARWSGSSEARTPFRSHELLADVSGISQDSASGPGATSSQRWEGAKMPFGHTSRSRNRKTKGLINSMRLNSCHLQVVPPYLNRFERFTISCLRLCRRSLTMSDKHGGCFWVLVIAGNPNTEKMIFSSLIVSDMFCPETSTRPNSSIPPSSQFVFSRLPYSNI